MKGFKKDGKFIPTGNKSKSNLTKSDVTKKISSSSGVGHEMRNKKTVWEAKLEEPMLEEGTNTHIIELGEKASEHEVKNALMRMNRKDGSPMYYEQDVNEPYLHYIKKIGEIDDSTTNDDMDKVLEELKNDFGTMSDQEKISKLRELEKAMIIEVDKHQAKRWNGLSPKTKSIAEDWWTAISEGGLDMDIMSVSDVYPSTVEGYEHGDPLSFDEFTHTEKMKLIDRAGGEGGMIEKIADEWRLDFEDVEERYH